MNPNSFEHRHIGVKQNEIKKMLKSIGVNSIDKLIEETIPKSIRKKGKLVIDDGISEHD